MRMQRVDLFYLSLRAVQCVPNIPRHSQTAQLFEIQEASVVREPPSVSRPSHEPSPAKTLSQFATHRDESVEVLRDSIPPRSRDGPIEASWHEISCQNRKRHSTA